MEMTIMMQRMSLGTSSLTKDGTNQFALDQMTHDMAALLIDVQNILLNYGNQLRDNRLLGPWSAVLLIRRTFRQRW